MTKLLSVLGLPLLLSMLVIVNCECSNEILNPYCVKSELCFIDESGEIVVVTNPSEFTKFNFANSDCSLGATVCDKETGDIVCDGYQPPEEYATSEICDDIDNDCNFLTDEGIVREYLDIDNTCLNNNGGCIQKQRCYDGTFHCELVWPELCREEICNGFDDDGDGLVDGQDPDLYPNGPEFYWPEDTHPSDDYSFASDSACRPGLVRCIDGQTYYEGLELPYTEQCGDFIDNDCDGVVDEIENPDYQASYALVIDISGSMGSAINAATNAACNFSQNTILGNSYFSVSFVGINHELAVNEIMLGLDFTNSIDLCSYLQAKPWLQFPGGYEFQPEGMMATHQSYPILLSDGSVPQDQFGNAINYSFNWPLGLNKKVVIFTDEMLQVTEGFDLSSFTDHCDTEDYQIGVFTLDPYKSQWYPIRNQCGGFVSTLYDSSYFMEQELIQNLTGGC